MRTRIVTLATALVLLLAGTAAINATASEKIPSNIDLLYTPAQPGFVAELGGYITSPLDDCLPKRKVQIYRKEDGDDRRIGPVLKTSSGGWYHLPVPNALPGKYYSKVKKRDVGFICKGAKSPSVKIPA